MVWLCGCGCVCVVHHVLTSVVCSIKMLQAITTRAEGASGVGAVELRNELNTSPLAKGQHEIHFLKIRPDVITPQTLASNILVSSVVRSPLLSLYHTLHQVRLGLVCCACHSHTRTRTHR